MKKSALFLILYFSIFNSYAKIPEYIYQTVEPVNNGLVSVFDSQVKNILLAEEKSKNTIQTALDVAVDFWKPIFTKVVHPINNGVDAALDSQARNILILEEKTKSALRTTVDFWGPIFNQKIHPSMVSTYRFVNKNLGPAPGEIVEVLAQSGKQVLSNQKKIIGNYWYSLSPTFWKDLNHIPAPVKIGFNKYEDWAINSIIIDRKKDFEESQKGHSYCSALSPAHLTPHFQEDIQANVLAIANNLQRIDQNNAEEVFQFRVYQDRAEKVLSTIKDYAEDPEMVSWYEVEVRKGSSVNAFNLGYKIYVTDTVLELFPDDKHLRAVLAHEISHGDHGHLVKNMFNLLLGTTSKYTVTLLAEEIKFLVSGETGPTLASFMGDAPDPNNPLSKDPLARSLFYMSCAKEMWIDGLLRRYANDAVQIEIDADQGATRILLAGGYSENDLIEALSHLHHHIIDKAVSRAPLEDQEKVRKEMEEIYIQGKKAQAGDQLSFRNYPTLNERISAIKSAAQKYRAEMSTY